MDVHSEGAYASLPIDETDRKIISILGKHGRISYTDLGKEVGPFRVAVQARVTALMDSGVIERFAAVINPEKVGIAVSAFLTWRLSRSICSRLRTHWRTNRMSQACTI